MERSDKKEPQLAAEALVATFATNRRAGGTRHSLSEIEGAVKLWCDGLCEPRNPGGWACWGWLAEDATGRRLASDHGCIGHGDGMTNNLAEYHGAVLALRWAADQGLHGVTLFSDSQLLVNHANGAWQCKAPNLWPLLAELRALMAATGARIEWIERERNGRADQLTRNAYGDAVRKARL